MVVVVVFVRRNYKVPDATVHDYKYVKHSVDKEFGGNLTQSLGTEND